MPVRYVFRDPSVGTLAYQIKAGGEKFSPAMASGRYVTN
jgi:hypothetical protein